MIGTGRGDDVVLQQLREAHQGQRQSRSPLHRVLHRSTRNAKRFPSGDFGMAGDA
jgi:hypothetical protein